jgi:hypothetical protein
MIAAIVSAVSDSNRAAIPAVLVGALVERNNPEVSETQTARADAVIDVTPPLIAMLNESLPDPRGAYHRRLEHRVARVIDKDDTWPLSGG